MAREYVDSSSIEWFEYDDATNCIDLAYVDGDVYRYHNVPPPICDGLRVAPSRGRYVNTVIKPHYRCTRLTTRR